MAFNKTVVFDLDGTLANNDHRVHLAQAKEWDAFHVLGERDPVIEGTKALYLGASLLYSVVVLTGRNERYRLMTMGWLTRNEIYVDALLMRPDGNFDKDADIKPRLLQEHYFGQLNSYCCDIKLAIEKTVFVVEDRDSMVEAWRNLGFQCFQARPGAY